MKRLLSAITFLVLVCSLAPHPARAQATDPFLGEIQLFAFNFCPKGWVRANGAILSISQNTALFALLGTTYGGDGLSYFALPNWGPIPVAGGATLTACIALVGVFPSQG